MLYRISGDCLQQSSDVIRDEWITRGRIIHRAGIFLGNLLNIYWVNLLNDRKNTWVFRQYNDREDINPTLGRVTLFRKIGFIDWKDNTKIIYSKARMLQKIKVSGKIGNGEGIGEHSLRSAGMQLTRNVGDFSDESYNPDDEIRKLEKTNRKEKRTLVSKDERVAEYIRQIALRKKIEKKQDRKEGAEINTAGISTVSTARPSVFRYTSLVAFIQQFPQKIVSLSVPKEKAIYKDGAILVR